MTPDDLDALADAATPGPWWWDSYATVYMPEANEGDPVIAKVSTGYDGTEYMAEGTHNARLIALAPTLARDLAALQRWAEKAAEAMAPYVEHAAPHERLFSGEDLRNFERLDALLAEYAEMKEGTK